MRLQQAANKLKLSLDSATTVIFKQQHSYLAGEGTVADAGSLLLFIRSLTAAGTSDAQNSPFGSLLLLTCIATPSEQAFYTFPEVCPSSAAQLVKSTDISQ